MDAEGQPLVLSCVIDGPLGPLQVHCAQWSRGLEHAALRLQQSEATVAAVAAVGAAVPALMREARLAAAPAASDPNAKGECRSCVFVCWAGCLSVHGGQKLALVLLRLRCICVRASAPVWPADTKFDKFRMCCPDDVVMDETAEWHEGFCPAILCVDCNAVPDSDEVRRLTGKSAPSCLFSHHSSRVLRDQSFARCFSLYLLAAVFSTVPCPAISLSCPNRCSANCNVVVFAKQHLA